jgi:phosphohistidine phosphatase
MRRLLLLRHAKSSWAIPGQRDFDRPLSPRGLRAAPRIARYVADHGLAPDAVICSPARRTRATLDLMLETLPAPASVRYDQALYEGTAATLVALVRAGGDEHATIMIVGHNPGMQDAAILLVAADDRPMSREIADKYPTAALAVIDFACDRWADVAPDNGTLQAFVTPRGLEQS